MLIYSKCHNEKLLLFRITEKLKFDLLKWNWVNSDSHFDMSRKPPKNIQQKKNWSFAEHKSVQSNQVIHSCPHLHRWDNLVHHHIFGMNCSKFHHCKCYRDKAVNWNNQKLSSTRVQSKPLTSCASGCTTGQFNSSVPSAQSENPLQRLVIAMHLPLQLNSSSKHVRSKIWKVY